MIPKKIHYVWLGEKPMGEIEQKCLESWRRVLPEYEIIAWGNKDIARIQNPYFQEAVAAKEWAFASDYLRLFALWHEGGIYMDTDEEVLRPLDAFLSHDFFMGCQRCGTAKGVSPALVGATPHNPVIAAQLAVYDDKHFIKPDGSYDKTPNPVYFSEVFVNTYGVAPKDLFLKKGRIQITDNAYLYDYDHFGRENKKAYAVHRYAASWRPDWKIRDKVSFRWGKARYTVRKYKKRREAPLLLNPGEKIVWKHRFSDYVVWSLIKKQENKA